MHARSQSESRCADRHILLVLQQLRRRLRSPVSSSSGHAVVERLPQGAIWFPGIRALIRRFFSSPIGYTSAEPEAARAKRGLAYFRCDQHTRWPCPRPLWFLLLVPGSGEMKRATVYGHLVILCANIFPSAERMRHEDNGLAVKLQAPRHVLIHAVTWPWSRLFRAGSGGLDPR